MIRKVLLIGLVLFVMCSVGIVVVEHVRGRRQLAGILREMEGRGQVTRIESLAPAGSPEGAAVLETLVLATQQITDFNPIAPPGYVMLGPGRALPCTRMTWWVGSGGRSNNWSAVEAWVERNATLIDTIHSALAATNRTRSQDYSQGFARVDFRPFVTYKGCVNALGNSALEAAHRGDLDGALEALQAMQVVDRDLAKEPMVLPQLVRIACRSIINGRLWAVLHARDWSDEQLAAIQAVLPPADLVASYLHGLEGERVLAVESVRHMSDVQMADFIAMDSAFVSLPSSGPGVTLSMPADREEALRLAADLLRGLVSGIRTRVVVPIWRFGWGDQAAVHHLKATDVALRIERETMSRSSWASRQTPELEALARPLGGYARIRSLLVSRQLESLVTGPRGAYRCEMESALNEAGLAVMRHLKRHGRLPATLDELVPEFLKRVPTDWMDGRPLRYQRETETQFSLWSVGENLSDEGGNASGKGAWDGDGDFRWWRAVDAVWPLVGSEEQISAWQAKQERKLASAATKGGATRFLMDPELMRRYGLIPPSGTTTNAPGASTNTVPSPQAGGPGPGKEN